MANAAHQLAEILESWRGITARNASEVIKSAAQNSGMSAPDLLVHTAALAHKTDHMFKELQNIGQDIEYFETARDAWMRAPFLYGVGWGNSGMQPDHIIKEHDLSLLKAFAVQYDLAALPPKPNKAVIDSFIEELTPIAEFVGGLDISSKTKTLILQKIESAKTLLADDDVKFDVILTKLGEILGLLMILAESVTDEKTKAKLWEKVRDFAGNFVRDTTINTISGAANNAVMTAIGM